MGDVPTWTDTLVDLGSAFAAIAAAVVAAIALVVQRSTNREERSRQSEAAREERQLQREAAKEMLELEQRSTREHRTWEKRIDLYVSLLRTIDINHVRDVPTVGHDDALRQEAAKQLVALSDLFPLVDALAEDQILERFDEYWLACQRFVDSSVEDSHSAWASERWRFRIALRDSARNV